MVYTERWYANDADTLTKKFHSGALILAYQTFVCLLGFQNYYKRNETPPQKKNQTNKQTPKPIERKTGL